MQEQQSILTPTVEIIKELAQGKMVILMDDEDRENEGDLVMLADFVTPDAINFMARHGRGLICLTINEQRSKQLDLAPMVSQNRSSMNTAFTASIEAASGVSTGISAFDRAHTIKVAVAKNAKPNDLVQPGHIFPIIAKNGGVLVRAGHTEAGCDLANLAGYEPSAVICEILRDDGQMARLPDLLGFAQEHQLKIGTIEDLIQYRAASERLVSCQMRKKVNTAYGEFNLSIYNDCTTGALHLALVKGEINSEQISLVRVHQPLSLADFIDQDNFSGSFALADVMRELNRIGSGTIILMHQTEDVASLQAKLSIEKIISQSKSTSEQINSQNQIAAKSKPWDPRTYGIGAQILRDLKINKFKLIGSQQRFPSMHGFDLELHGFVSSLEELGKI